MLEARFVSNINEVISLFNSDLETMPVYGTIASQFNDPGTNALFAALIEKLNEKTGTDWCVPFHKE